jgi:hypothetical protein
MKRRAIASLVAAAIVLAACQTVPEPVSAPAPAPAAPPTASVAALYRQPAERALVEGIRLYEEAAFDRAEQALRKALRLGLADPRDRAAAYKYIAFVACAFNRIVDCEASFQSAYAADPKFSLTEAEIGHPVWGPVYKRIAATQPKQ